MQVCRHMKWPSTSTAKQKHPRSTQATSSYRVGNRSVSEPIFVGASLSMYLPWHSVVTLPPARFKNICDVPCNFRKQILYRCHWCYAATTAPVWHFIWAFAPYFKLTFHLFFFQVTKIRASKLAEFDERSQAVQRKTLRSCFWDGPGSLQGIKLLLTLFSIFFSSLWPLMPAATLIYCLLFPGTSVSTLTK